MGHTEDNLKKSNEEIKSQFLPPLKLGLLLEARLNSSFSGGEEEDDVKEGEAAETSENSISCSVVAEGIVLRVDVGGLNIWLVLIVKLS